MTRQASSDRHATDVGPRISERTNLQDQSGDTAKSITKYLANQTYGEELTDIKNLVQSKITYTGITLTKNPHASLMPWQKLVDEANVNIHNSLSPAKENAFAGGLPPETTYLFLGANGSAEFCASAVAPTQEQSIANCSAYPPATSCKPCFPIGMVRWQTATAAMPFITRVPNRSTLPPARRTQGRAGEPAIPPA
jgi:hypothetical protein